MKKGLKQLVDKLEHKELIELEDYICLERAKKEHYETKSGYKMPVWIDEAYYSFSRGLVWSHSRYCFLDKYRRQKFTGSLPSSERAIDHYYIKGHPEESGE